MENKTVEMVVKDLLLADNRKRREEYIDRLRIDHTSTHRTFV